MGSDWIKTTIGEQLTLQRGFDITKKQQCKGSIPVVSSGGISSYHNESKVKGPGVVLGRKGSLGTVFFIEEDFWPHDTSLFVKDFNKNIPRFVYYFFQNMATDLKRMDVGAANPALNRNHVHPIIVKWPSIDNQNKIVQILGTLDDKIALNTQINATLESMAQALFKSWLVDFDPVKAKMDARAAGGDDYTVRHAAISVISGKSSEELNALKEKDPKAYDELVKTADLFPEKMIESELGEIPEGWEIGMIGNIANAMGGYAFKSEQFINLGNPVIKIKDITGTGTVDSTNCAFISDESAKKVSRFQLSDGDLVMAMTGATVGKIGLVITYGKTMFLNQRVAKFTSQKFGNDIAYFLYCLFNRKEYFEMVVNAAHGSAQPNISSTSIESVRTILPTANVVKCFLKKVKPYYSEWIVNNKESKLLSETRDTLLPKLLSGEIDLSTPTPQLQEYSE